MNLWRKIFLLISDFEKALSTVEFVSLMSINSFFLQLFFWIPPEYFDFLVFVFLFVKILKYDFCSDKESDRNVCDSESDALNIDETKEEIDDEDLKGEEAAEEEDPDLTHQSHVATKKVPGGEEAEPETGSKGAESPNEPVSAVIASELESPEETKSSVQEPEPAPTESSSANETQSSQDLDAKKKSPPTSDCLPTSDAPPTSDADVSMKKLEGFLDTITINKSDGGIGNFLRQQRPTLD